MGGVFGLGAGKFIAFSAEEWGLHGSRHYAQAQTLATALMRARSSQEVTVGG